MLTSRPVIFISAVSKELHSARDLVAKTLISLGYEPKWQDIAPTETGDLRAVLRKWVDESHAVIQIVGYRYGAAPKVTDPAFPHCSYTQYEALYARQKGKPVWYIILDEIHPVDPADPEPEELRQLQADYRTQVRVHGNLYHRSADLLHTENIVLRLRSDLAKLRRRARQWAALFLILLILSLGGISWMVLKQKDTQKEVIAVKQQNTELLAAVRALPSALAQAQQAAPQEDSAARTARAYASLEESLKLPPGTLAKELPAFAEMLLRRADTSEMDRANALFATKQYSQSEAAALRAKDHALAATGQPVKDAVAALVLAGQSATEQIQYKRALEHCRAAAALTSEERDVLEWADIQNKIGWLLYHDGQYDAQAILTRRVWQACEKAGHQDSPISLRAHQIWANALYSQGKYADAEQEHRAMLDIRGRVLGPEHPDTLMSRNNLAAALDSQGKHAEAEKEHRAVLVIRERVLGPEHPDTLGSRMNLANALDIQGKHAEAEKEYRAMLPIQESVLGPEHPDTLTSRVNLGIALNSQDKDAEAELELRAVLVIRERVLGPEHPGTLTCRMNLASALYSQGKHAEAEKEYRDVLTIRMRVLGPEHPFVFLSCYNLSLCLENQGKKPEALEFARRALAGRTKVLGEQHPDTNLAKRHVADLERE